MSHPLLPSTVVLALISVGCAADDNPLPPPFQGEAVEAVSCGELQDAPPSGAAFGWDGGDARCAADGLFCVLTRGPAAGLCSASELSMAQCNVGRWLQVCLPRPDAGPGDAGND